MRSNKGGATILKVRGTKDDSRAIVPPLFQMWGYKQANVSLEYTEICCLVVALINMTTQTRRLHCVE